MKTRSQSRASSSDWIGRCLPASIRGIANSFAGTCTFAWIVARWPCNLLHSWLLSCELFIREYHRRAAPNPIHHGGMKPPSSDGKALPNELPTQVRAPHGLFVAADELGHLERGYRPMWQVVVRGRRVRRQPRRICSMRGPRCASSSSSAPSRTSGVEHVRSTPGSGIDEPSRDGATGGRSA
jgi:hypothetical protein